MIAWQLRVFGEYPSILRTMSLISGCLCIIMSGSIEGFSSYAASIKAQYNYTQFEVDLLAAVSAMGVNFGYPSGFAMERFGYAGTLMLALVLSGGASLLIWHSTFAMTYYSGRVYLLVIYFFLFGFGVMFSHMTPLSVNMENFPPKHRGKVVALLISAYNIGASLLSLIFFTAFVPHHAAVLKGDLTGYYLFITVSLSVTTIFAIIFTGEYPDKTSREHNEEYIAMEMDAEANRKSRTWRDQIRFLVDPDFQLICWAYVLLGSVTYTFRTNVVFYLGSFGHQGEGAAVSIVQPIVAIAASFLFSGISDAVITWVPRSGILLGLSVILTVTLVLAIFYLGDLIFFYWFLGVMLTCDGVAWTLTPTLLSEYFGKETFARAWGMCTFAMSLVCLGCLEIFGALYDHAKIYYFDPVQCHGLHCYTWSTAFYIGILIITCMLYSLLLWRSLVRNKYQIATELDEPFSEMNKESQPLTIARSTEFNEDMSRSENPPSYASISAY